MPEQIINVVEIQKGAILAISSFIIHDEIGKEDKVKAAESHYMSCVRSHRSDYDDLPIDPIEVSDELIMENDYFNNNADYEVSIVWSHSVE